MRDAQLPHFLSRASDDDIDRDTRAVRDDAYEVLARSGADRRRRGGATARA